MAETVTVTRLGARGDGIVDGGDEAIFIPGLLPGETAEIERFGERGTVLRRLTSSAQRQTPPCPHFGPCGGCVAQHLAPDMYAAWKVDLLRDALARVGLSPAIRPLTLIPPRSRRRVTLALASHGGRTVLGFHGARTHDLVPVTQCEIMDPALVAALPTLTALLAPCAPAKGSVAVTILLTASGIDVAVDAKPPASPTARARLTDGARAAGVARLTLAGDTLATFRAPFIDVDGFSVVPPPGGFVQAVADAETALAADVTNALAGARRVVDLFAGSGAFALRLARRIAVHAVEGDGPALAALQAAAAGAQGLKPVTVEKRDLYRRPLQPAELRRYDAAVLDPPRQGAESQVATLATSGLKTIVYVSCNPTTFARDAAILTAAGYRLEHITPVDQFVWSPHLETSAAFRL